MGKSDIDALSWKEVMRDIIKPQFHWIISHYTHKLKFFKKNVMKQKVLLNRDIL